MHRSITVLGCVTPFRWKWLVLPYCIRGNVPGTSIQQRNSGLHVRHIFGGWQRPYVIKELFADAFRPVPGNLYRDKQGADPDAACNELVIRIQPKEAIYLKINNKVSQLSASIHLCSPISHHSRARPDHEAVHERLDYLWPGGISLVWRSCTPYQQYCSVWYSANSKSCWVVS